MVVSLGLFLFLVATPAKEAPARQNTPGLTVRQGQSERTVRPDNSRSHQPAARAEANRRLPRATEARAGSYRQRREQVLQRDPKARKVPVIPPQGQQIRVVIDSDAKNEIDDLWAIALALLAPERFKIEGFVAANFDNSRPEGGLDSIEASRREIETLLVPGPQEGILRSGRHRGPGRSEPGVLGNRQVSRRGLGPGLQVQRDKGFDSTGRDIDRDRTFDLFRRKLQTLSRQNTLGKETAP